MHYYNSVDHERDCDSGGRAEPPLDVFGYFQTEFYHDGDQGVERNTFVLQQLNLFFQRDFERDFTAFVNFEMTNTYSSFQKWGSFNLEEAWVRDAEFRPTT